MEESVTPSDPRPASRLAGDLLFVLASGIGVALVAVAVLGPEAERRLILERQIGAMQAEVNLLQQTRDQLAAAERALRSDPDYRERIIRHELGITRPGEIRVPQPVSPEDIRAATALPAPPAPPPWLTALAWFADPAIRVLTMATGGTLLLAAVLFSLPILQAGPKPAAAPAET